MWMDQPSQLTNLTHSLTSTNSLFHLNFPLESSIPYTSQSLQSRHIKRKRSERTWGKKKFQLNIWSSIIFRPKFPPNRFARRWMLSLLPYISKWVAVGWNGVKAQCDSLYGSLYSGTFVWCLLSEIFKALHWGFTKKKELLFQKRWMCYMYVYISYKYKNRRDESVYGSESILAFLGIALLAR